MRNNPDSSLRPRNGSVLWVLLICRISTEHQDEKSLADQEALLRRYVQDKYQGPVQFEVIASRGSGEYLDRKELERTEELIDSGRFDLVLVEDLARICRRVRAYDICEMAEDKDTRVIALNDFVDRGTEGWQQNALFSVLRHKSYNRDTAKRIKRSLSNRFMKGEVLRPPIYGYIKPEGAKTDADLRKDPAAERYLDEWFTRLEHGASYSEIADWLNSEGVRPGLSCKGDRWDVSRVRYVTLKPILKGVRVRNRRKSQRVNKTGRRRSIEAPPEERLERAVPHLAFIELDRYDRVIALLTRRNAKYRRNAEGKPDPRKNGSSANRVGSFDVFSP